MKKNHTEILKKVFKSKKVLITGHTGFKGSWLSLCLRYLGANVLGISKNIPSSPSNFLSSNIDKIVKSKTLDIKKIDKIKAAINRFQPDFIFHLAAQSLVGVSYEKPLITWNSNLMGTVNILETLKEFKKRVTVVIITSDKSYKNVEKKSGYKETDLLGGEDPYSASKSAAEIAINSYFNSFLKKKKNINIGIARAGNVIGGGDWSKDRLIPDCIRSWSKKRKVEIRNPNSTRPWQHVLEAVWGYVFFAYKLKLNNKLNGQAFNFGPKSKKNYKVSELLKVIQSYWSDVNYNYPKNRKKFNESKLLKLNCSKAKKLLKWESVLNFNETAKLTADWYYSYYFKNKRTQAISLDQIKNFEKIFNQRN